MMNTPDACLFASLDLIPANNFLNIRVLNVQQLEGGLGPLSQASMLFRVEAFNCFRIASPPVWPDSVHTLRRHGVGRYSRSFLVATPGQDAHRASTTHNRSSGPIPWQR